MADEKPKDSAKETRREIEQTEQASRRALGTLERLASGMASAVAASTRRALESVGQVAGQVAGSVQGMAQRATAAAQQGARAVEAAYTAASRKVSAAASRAPRNQPGGGGRGPGGGGDEPLTLGDVPKRGLKGTIADVGGELMGKLRAHPVAVMAEKGLKAVKDFGVAAVQAAMKSQAAWSKLGHTMRKSGVDLADKQDELNARAREFTKNTTFGTDQYVEGLTRMIGITGDYGSSVQNMALAADVAAKRNTDLSSAAELVGKVAQGDAEALDAMGISSGSAQDGLARLSEECGGFAQNQASTLDGKVKQLNNAWGDFKTAVGNAMIEAGGGTSIMDTLRGVVVTVTDAFVRNKDIIVAWAKAGIELIAGVGSVAGSLIRIMLHVAEGTADLVRMVSSGVEGLVLGAVNKVLQGINLVIRGLNDLTGMKLSLLGTLEVQLQRNAADQAAAATGLKGHFRGIGDELGGILNTGRKVASGFTTAWNTQSGSTPATRRSFPSTPKTAPQKRRQTGAGAGTASGSASRDGGARNRDEVREPAAAPAACECDAADTSNQEKAIELTERRADAQGRLVEGETDLVGQQEKDLEQLERAAKFAEERTEALALARKLEGQLTEALKNQNLALADRLAIRERLSRVTEVRTGLEKAQKADDDRRKKGPETKDLSLARLGKAAKSAKDLLQNMEKGAEASGNKVAGAMAGAFEKMLSGAASVGEVLDGLWKSMAKGALQGIAAKAQGKAGEEAAEAISALARGIQYASTPFMQPYAAGQFAAATKHLAAAAAWSALAGGMGAAASAVGGGGAASSSSSPQSSRDAGSAVAQSAEKRGPEIHIYVDGIDPTNPRHQKLTQQTLRGVRERYGSDGTVTYAPRRAG